MKNENRISTSDNNSNSCSGKEIEILKGENHQDFWCFTWIENARLAEGAEKAALLKDVKWKKGDNITISFLDGDPEVQGKVINVAQQWVMPGLANLTFDFRENTKETNIRISFRYKGSWSVLGTSCKYITNLDEPTMNFGWLNKHSTDDEVKRVVLHEFGHALGLTHEHMNPGGKVKWNRKQVIEDLSGPPNNWTEDEIEINMFQTFEKHETNFTELDSKSIMMYPIPAKWTTDGFRVGLNSELSEVDIKFIKVEY